MARECGIQKSLLQFETRNLIINYLFIDVTRQDMIRRDLLEITLRLPSLVCQFCRNNNLYGIYTAAVPIYYFQCFRSVVYYICQVIRNLARLPPLKMKRHIALIAESYIVNISCLSPSLSLSLSMLR